jgi:hypothetical protein
MFSAQLDGVLRSPMGMNHPAAAENPRFLLNVMRWLAGWNRSRGIAAHYPAFPGTETIEMLSRRPT